MPDLTRSSAQSSGVDLDIIEAGLTTVGVAAAGEGPFAGYRRVLTEDGVLITYRDQNRNWPLAIVRVLVWLMGMWTVTWSVMASDLTSVQALLALVVASVGITLLARIRLIRSHSIEIRSDAMVVDGEDIFYVKDIGDNWPVIQPVDGDPDVMMLAGIYGTRQVEYTTVNRLDKNDRTPEVLGTDLKVAMEQLWGRRELTFPAQ